jgi:hypothetical protein
MKNSNGTIGNWTRNLLACSTVPQPTAPLCAPRGLQSNEQNVTFILVCGSLYRHSLQSKIRMPNMENMSVPDLLSVGFLPNSVYKFFTESCYINVSFTKFHSGKMLYLVYNWNATCIFYSFHQTLITSRAEDAHKSWFKYYQFPENQHNESHSILKGINVLTYVPSTITVQFGWDSVQRMWT